jgi:hypothetical protein
MPGSLQHLDFVQSSSVVAAHSSVVVVTVTVVDVADVDVVVLVVFVFVVVVTGRPGVRCPRVAQVHGMRSPNADSTSGVQANKQLAQ